jgi:TIR domain
MEKQNKIFISYSWDNEAHKEWVLNLANVLSEKGLYVLFDRYDLQAGKNLTHFMERSISEADKVLMIMTPNFKIKAEGQKGGVGFEYSICRQEMFEKQDSIKFIPVLRSLDRRSSTPVFLRNYVYFDMSDDNNFALNIDELSNLITESPRIKRPQKKEEKVNEFTYNEHSTSSHHSQLPDFHKDDAAFLRAIKLNTVDSLKEYLDNPDNTKHRADAESALDSAAFEKAKIANTIEAYNEYRSNSNFKKHRFAAELEIEVLMYGYTLDFDHDFGD